MPCDKPVEVRAVVSYSDKTVADAQAQHTEDHKTQKSIKKATWAAVVAASIYALISLYMSCQMVKANHLAHETLVSQSRAWLNIEGIILKDPQPTAMNSPWNFTYKVRNYGSYPAGIVNSEFALSHAASYPFQEIKTLCQKVIPNEPRAFDTVFPGPDGGKISPITYQVRLPEGDPQWLIASIAYKDREEEPIRYLLTLYEIDWNKPVDDKGRPVPRVPTLKLFDTKMECRP